MLLKLKIKILMMMIVEAVEVDELDEEYILDDEEFVIQEGSV